MSAKNEKLRRRVDRQDQRLEDLEVCVTQIRLEQKRKDRFEDALHAARRQNAAEDYSARREAADRARLAERRAKAWQLAAVMAMLLLAMMAATTFAGESQSTEPQEPKTVTTCEAPPKSLYVLDPGPL